jgi:hypothetical protein
MFWDSSETRTHSAFPVRTSATGKLDELAGKCSETVQGTVRNELQSSLRSILGGSGWHVNEDPADRDHQGLLFAIRPA